VARMSWASHPTTEMPTDSFTAGGRHRARHGVAATVVAAFGLAALLGGAMLAPTLIGWPPPADTAAHTHSIDMARAGLFGHSGADGIDPGERMRRAGYDFGRGWAENIARGQPNAATVMASWLGSTGHSANILDGSLRAIGIGAARDVSGQLFWTQDFGGR